MYQRALQHFELTIYTLYTNEVVYMWCYEDTVGDYCIPNISLVLVSLNILLMYIVIRNSLNSEIVQYRDA